jgi:hypothetical protein
VVAGFELEEVLGAGTTGEHEGVEELRVGVGVVAGWDGRYRSCWCCWR